MSSIKKGDKLAWSSEAKLDGAIKMRIFSAQQVNIETPTVLEVHNLNGSSPDGYNLLKINVPGDTKEFTWISARWFTSQAKQ